MPCPYRRYILRNKLQMKLSIQDVSIVWVMLVLRPETIAYTHSGNYHHQNGFQINTLPPLTRFPCLYCSPSSPLLPHSLFFVNKCHWVQYCITALGLYSQLICQGNEHNDHTSIIIAGNANCELLMAKLNSC